MIMPSHAVPPHPRQRPRVELGPTHHPIVGIEPELDCEAQVRALRAPPAPRRLQPRRRLSRALGLRGRACALLRDLFIQDAGKLALVRDVRAGLPENRRGRGRGRVLPLRGGEPAPLLFVRRHLREEVEAVLRGRLRPALPLPVGVDLPRGVNRFKC